MIPDEVPILRTDRVTKSFGGIRAVDRCTLGIKSGKITGLIGPNGAGKTTLINIIAGLYARDEGTITLKEERIDGRPPFEIVQKGVVKTFQIPREFRNLTVLENVMVAYPGHPGERPLSALIGWRRVWDKEEEVRKKALDILALVELDSLLLQRELPTALVELDRLSDANASELSGGQKKLLELARSLMVDPKVVLLDEPLAGVNPTLTGKLLGIIEGLRDRGSTFFMIEHDMDVVMNRCDHVIAMHQGRPIAEGAPDEVRHNELVMEAYLGG